MCVIYLILKVGSSSSECKIANFIFRHGMWVLRTIHLYAWRARTPQPLACGGRQRQRARDEVESPIHPRPWSSSFSRCHFLPQVLLITHDDRRWWRPQQLLHDGDQSIDIDIGGGASSGGYVLFRCYYYAVDTLMWWLWWFCMVFIWFCGVRGIDSAAVWVTVCAACWGQQQQQLRVQQP